MFFKRTSKILLLNYTDKSQSFMIAVIKFGEKSFNL